LNTRNYIEKLNGKINIVGKNIKLLREQNNISRQILSDKLMILGIDISSQSIFDIETGSRTVVDYELCAIAKVLNTTADKLMQDFKEYLDNI
jgi:transcriptional regulator with XRE-family HTH domain